MVAAGTVPARAKLVLPTPFLALAKSMEMMPIPAPGRKRQDTP